VPDASVADASVPEEPLYGEVLRAGAVATGIAQEVTSTPEPGGTEVDGPVESIGTEDALDAAAAPVDMASLYAPAAVDDATAVLPVLTESATGSATVVPSNDVAGKSDVEPDAADTTGPVAPAETQHPAG